MSPSSGCILRNVDAWAALKLSLKWTPVAQQSYNRGNDFLFVALELLWDCRVTAVVRSASGCFLGNLFFNNIYYVYVCVYNESRHACTVPIQSHFSCKNRKKNKQRSEVHNIFTWLNTIKQKTVIYLSRCQSGVVLRLCFQYSSLQLFFCVINTRALSKYKFSFLIPIMASCQESDGTVQRVCLSSEFLLLSFLIHDFIS